MSHDRKLSVLESLLERVKNRAAGPRAATPNRGVTNAGEVRLDGAEAAQAAAASPGTPAPPPASPSALHLEPPPAPEELVSEPPPVEVEDEGPPSAPRLREGLVDQEEQEQDQDFQDDEGPIKTPPPESGRQHVASPVPSAAQEPADDLDMDISITVAEASPEPPAAAAAPPEPPPPAPPAPIDLGVDMAGPLPRLAFVSEPEIELHVTRSHVTPPSAPRSEDAPTSAPTSAVIAIPTGEPEPLPEPARAPEPPRAAEPAPAPEPVAASLPEVRAPAPPSVPPPVRLMAHPAADAPGGAAPAPVEVWASTHAPAALRGQVASFVGQNVAFAPKSFGELLDASLELGES